MDSTASSAKPLHDTAQHKFFDVVVILKGLNGVLELIGGTALLLIPAAAIVDLVSYLTQSELSNDPTDFFSSALMTWAQNFTGDGQHFAALYLLFHGIAKTSLATLLLMGQRIAYPVAIAFFSAFVCYALYRLLDIHWSWFLLGFVLFDIFTIAVIWREWMAERQAAVA